MPVALVGLFIVRGIGDFLQTYCPGYVGRRIVKTLPIEEATRERVGLLAYSPLAFGLLTGKYLDGARPDVQALFPTSPRNTRAGWGYLMLTNFLPNLGNGTFRLTAIADDADGCFSGGARFVHLPAREWLEREAELLTPSNRDPLVEGMNFLPKPFQPDRLAHIVRAVLDHRE